MAIYASLLSLFISLFFTACQSAPSVPLSPELDQYALVKENCEGLRTTPGIYVPDTLDNECRTFLQRLDKANSYDYKLGKYKAEHKGENVNLMSEYILLQTDANRQNRKAELEYQALTNLLNSLSLEAIADNQQADVELTLSFRETTFTKEHYYYYKTFAPQYDEDPQYRSFEKSYANELISQGLVFLSQGDKKHANKMFKTAASLNNAQAEYLIGIVYEAKYIDKAMTWHTKAKEHGIKSSRINLARLHSRKREQKEAQELYIEASKDGDAYAQYLLYRQYSKTTNTKTTNTAKEWLIRSAENGFPPAEYSYGQMLLKEKRREEAKEWLLKAKAHGISAADATLGAIYYKDKQYEEAFSYLDAADSSYAKYRLGKMYELGLGVEVNYYKSYMSYKQSVKLGKKGAKKDVSRLAKLKTEREEAHFHAQKRKDAQRQKAFVQRNGEEPILRNVRTKGMDIYLEGIVSLPLQSSHGFIIHTEDGKQFYIIDTNHKANVHKFQHVQITAKATGNAITVSSEEGLTDDIYQLYFQQHCP